jgi:hypothetical protein
VPIIPVPRMMIVILNEVRILELCKSKRENKFKIDLENWRNHLPRNVTPVNYRDQIAPQFEIYLSISWTRD